MKLKIKCLLGLLVAPILVFGDSDFRMFEAQGRAVEARIFNVDIQEILWICSFGTRSGRKLTRLYFQKRIRIPIVPKSIRGSFFEALRI